MGSVAGPGDEHRTVHVIDWALCGACGAQLELREESDFGHWVHVDSEGDYVYRNHYPEPSDGRLVAT
jgi:hypothetical protein